jgi:ubiquinone/menaquinone biosynthesis C-methylase UbiE
MSLRESLFQNPELSFQSHLFFQKNLGRDLLFEKNYISLREKENRIYTDDVVLRLPEIDYTHPLKKEWMVRKRSLQNLLNYFNRSGRPRKILELGCGNGWLCSHFADLPATEVLGADMNETELIQAANVFKKKDNLSFLYTDIMTSPLKEKFDYIVLASSLQYFKDVQVLLRRLQTLLADRGEIHIVDTPIYSVSDVDTARQRTADYFRKLAPEMQPFYHHHTWKSFDAFQTEVLYDPQSWTSKLKKLTSTYLPFYWVRITDNFITFPSFKR